MKTITIIGGGASGTLLAINLFRKCGDAELTVNLVEKRPVIGQGVAFSTQHDVHLLNVPADKMGAYPEDPAHFYAWLRGSGYGFTATEFVPRRLFGEYLQFLLRTLSKNAPKNIFFRIVADEAAGNRRRRRKSRSSVQLRRTPAIGRRGSGIRQFSSAEPERGK